MFARSKVAIASLTGLLTAAFAFIMPMAPAHADGVGSGTRDDPCQDAVCVISTAATAPADSTIYLSNGVFDLPTTLVLNGISLHGLTQTGTVIEPSPSFAGTSFDTGYGTTVPLIDAEPGTVRISTLTLRGPMPGAQGDAIYSAATALNVDHVTFSEIRPANRATYGTASTGTGIAVHNGDANITNSIFTNFQKRGILFLGDGTVTVTGCTFSGSTANPANPNGIVMASGTANINTSTFSNLNDNTPGHDPSYGILVDSDPMITTTIPVVTATNNIFTNVQAGLGTDRRSTAYAAVTANKNAFTGTGAGCTIGGLTKVVCDGTKLNVGVTYYTVTFLSANGTVQAAQTVQQGATIDASQVPVLSRPGYELLRWNTQADGNGAAFAPGTAVNANVVYYPIWASAATTIKYVANAPAGTSAAGRVTASPTVSFGSSFTPANGDFTVNNYIFAGWNTREDGKGTPFQAGQTVKLNDPGFFSTNPRMLYAQWTGVPVTVTFAANAPNGWTVNGTMPDQPMPFGTPFRAPTSKYNLDDLTFIGWNTAANGSGKSYPAGANVPVTSTNAITLYAQWARDAVIVSYDANAPAGTQVTGEMPDQAVPIGSFFTVADDAFSVPGYTFVGWNTKPTGLGADCPAGSNIPSLTASMTLYAQWVTVAPSTTHTTANRTIGGATAAPTGGSVTGGSITGGPAGLVCGLLLLATGVVMSMKRRHAIR